MGIVIVLSTVVAGVYYVRLVKIIYFQRDCWGLVWERVLCRGERADLMVSLLVGGCFYGVLLVMVFPGFILQMTYDAAADLLECIY